MRTKIAVLVTVGLAAFVFTAARVEASTNTRSVRAEYTATSPAPTIGVIECDAGGRCVGTYTVESTYTGDIEATSLTTGAAVLDQATGAVEGSSYHLVAGTIAGCGTGSWIVRTTSFTVEPGEPNGLRGSVVEGSGTGDLVGLSGSFTVTSYTQAPDGTASSAGYMRLRCNPK